MGNEGNYKGERRGESAETLCRATYHQIVPLQSPSVEKWVVSFKGCLKIALANLNPCITLQLVIKVTLLQATG